MHAFIHSFKRCLLSMCFQLIERVRECNQEQKDLKNTKEDNIDSNLSHDHGVLGISEYQGHRFLTALLQLRITLSLLAQNQRDFCLCASLLQLPAGLAPCHHAESKIYKYKLALTQLRKSTMEMMLLLMMNVLFPSDS